MKHAERQTRSHLMALFERHGFHPRTMFGQNFLIDINVIESIVTAANIGRNDVVLEVGAGTGGMTTYLTSQAGRVVSVEIDSDMHMLASEATAGDDNLRLLNCDALRNKNNFAPEVIEAVETALSEVRDQYGDAELKLVANLPYSVATPIISNLMATDLPWTRMVVTIQLELGQRMKAQPKQSTYGSLSAWCQAHGKVEIVRKLGPKVFWPRPKVDSAVVRIVRDPALEGTIVDKPVFHKYVRGVFQNRRKLIRNQLQSMYRKQLGKEWVDPFLVDMELPPNTRAEELDVAAHVRIANAIAPLLKDGVQP